MATHFCARQWRVGGFVSIRRLPLYTIAKGPHRYHASMLKAFNTELGESWLGLAEELDAKKFRHLEGSVDLIFTSPPFPLRKKKKYGNEVGTAYIDWISAFAPLISRLLSDSGSLVIEVGNAWEPGLPSMSTLPLRALLSLQEAAALHLCQQFIWHNPARLPTPAQWVTVERIRLKDSYTNIWWLAKSARPKADNRKVLTPYSSSMKKLLENGKYNSGTRPSEHAIGSKSFVADNGGAIPANVFTIANTGADSDYLRYCRTNGIRPHPARMPEDLPEFFIRFLTEPRDLVIDLFAGSNTTGSVAERLNRRWLAVEPRLDYISGSVGRFGNRIKRSNLRSLHARQRNESDLRPAPRKSSAA